MRRGPEAVERMLEKKSSIGWQYSVAIPMVYLKEWCCCLRSEC